jgi:dolichol-phosphate mannosyltransferase
VKVWVVLPAYNEAGNLPVLLDRLGALEEDTYRLELHVLVVDDGSTDGTADAARRRVRSLAVDVLVNPENRGLAETFMRGMTEAARRARPDDVVVCMDADNSHVPGQILRMVRGIQEGRDVVIASRYQPGAVVKGVPWLRRVLSRGMSILFRIVLPVEGVRDYSCGYRAYRAQFLQRSLSLQGETLFAKDGFACMVGILLRLARDGAVMGEVPLVLRYDQKVGASKMDVGGTIARTLLVLLRERLAR